jgi:hypothetical protein
VGVRSVANGFHPFAKFATELLENRRKFLISDAVVEFKGIVFLVEEELFIGITENEFPAITAYHPVTFARLTADAYAFGKYSLVMRSFGILE